MRGLYRRLPLSLESKVYLKAFVHRRLPSQWAHIIASPQALGVEFHKRLNGAMPVRQWTARARGLVEPHVAPVDIVICVHNALTDVQLCLEAVIRGTLPPYRIIIVDDGSDEPARVYVADFAARQGLTLIRNDRAAGYTYAANQGLRASSAEYVVLLNSDTVVPFGWLDRLVRCAESDSRIGLVGPLSNTASWQSVPKTEQDGDWAENAIPTPFNADDIAALITRNSECLYPRLAFLNGFCLMIRHVVIDEIGLFDEATFGEGYGEENDYCIRAKQAGWTLAVADDVYVFHRQSGSYSHERRKRLAARADEALAQKHDPVTHILPGVNQCRTDRLMLGIRARVQAACERELLRRNGLARWEGRRIGFVLPLTAEGGGGHVVLQEASAMQEMGIDVRLLNLHCNRRSFIESYPNNTSPVVYFETPDALTREVFQDPIPYDAIVATVNYSVAWLKCDVELSRGPVLGYYVQDFEPYFYPRESRDFRVAWDSYTLIPSMRLFTKTLWNRDLLKRTLGREAALVGPSVDIDLFRPRPRSQRHAPGVVHVCAMIRPSTPRRAPIKTLEILAHLRKRLGERVEINLFGSTDEELSSLGMHQSYFRNMGRLTRYEVADLLNDSDVFVDYSDFQAMGLTALEAMACGCAVVVPLQGGSGTFIVHEHNGLIVDTSDPKECLAETKRLITDAKLRERLGQQAIRDACSYPAERAAFHILEALFGDKRFRSDRKRS